MIKVILWTVAILLPFLVWYVLWGRDWLKKKSWMQWLYCSRVGEWVERHLFSKSETILWARILQTIGYGLTAIMSLGDVDLTPIVAILPESLRWLPPLLPLIISAAGHIQVKLREDTKTPLDIIAMSEADKQKPEVKAAIESLDKAKVEVAAVVAVVKEEAVVAANAGAA